MNALKNIVDITIDNQQPSPYFNIGKGSTTIPKGSREFTNYLFSKRQTVKQLNKVLSFGYYLKR